MTLTPRTHNLDNMTITLLKTQDQEVWNPSGETEWIIIPLSARIRSNPIADEIRNGTQIFQPSNNTSSLFLIFPNQEKYNEYLHAYKTLWAHREQLSPDTLPTELIASCDFPDGMIGLKIVADTVSPYSDKYVRNGLIVDPVGYLASEHGTIVNEMLTVSGQTQAVLS